MKGSGVNKPYLKISRGEEIAWLLAIGGEVVFLACLVTAHVVAPSLDPMRHQVSEYVHADAGAVMVVGFLAWATSLGATALYSWLRHRALLLATLFSLASFGVVLVAAFATQTSAGRLAAGVELTAAGRLHDLGSGLATLALLAAAVTAGFQIEVPRSIRRGTIVLVALAVLGSGVLLAVGPEVGGIRQRLVILAGCLWQLLLLKSLREIPERNGEISLDEEESRIP